MSSEHAHSKLLTAVAREHLGPLGVHRKGRSRTWLDDRGWWHLSFSVGGRVFLPEGEQHGQWFPFESEPQFAPVATRLATEAADRLVAYRTEFADVDVAAAALNCDNPSLLESLDAAVAYGVAGKPDDARPLFERYVAWSSSAEGRLAVVAERDDMVQARLEAVGDTARFRAMIANDISAKRSALKLDPTFAF